MVEIRKIIATREVVFSELGVKAPRPVVRAVGMAVITNPFAGRFVEDLRSLFEAGAMLGERLMPDLVKLLDRPAVSYGKGALVGVGGEMEHGGACVHPMLGKPMRLAHPIFCADSSGDVLYSKAPRSTPEPHRPLGGAIPITTSVSQLKADTGHPEISDPSLWESQPGVSASG
jgi:Amino acid synthesis